MAASLCKRSISRYAAPCRSAALLRPPAIHGGITSDSQNI
ncbi:hypothetical protein HMPREF9555_01597 [Selenomonas artemidis F0399]|uniref:Uncharacterized protein n=1 Tax=Selenomonas artemidis F0399 TaxID=749551 RepID=E7N3K7_9FIRM|nr:hypothetical protein HMPREF9555_01597 [Selenomonas artemidis F0399]